MGGDRRNYASRFRGRVDRGGDAPAFFIPFAWDKKSVPPEDWKGRND
jgi:hypothetical protein